jgi:hypothetical protein
MRSSMVYGRIAEKIRASLRFFAGTPNAFRCVLEPAKQQPYEMSGEKSLVQRIYELDELGLETISQS